MTHLNIGGHYVINAKNVTGQYYLRVQEKNIAKHINEADAELEYLIRYRFIKEGEPNPYQLIDSESLEIQSIDDKGSEITLTVDSVQPLEPRVSISDIKYLFTLGADKDDVQNVMICSTNSQIKRLKAFHPESFSAEKVELNILVFLFLCRKKAS